MRDHTWSKLQPKGTLRFKPQDNVTLYTSWSRGFRSGGFNQTGVGAVADANNIAGVNDLFNAEVADTVEVGAKAQSDNGRLNGSVALYSTKSTNGYFFVFLAANSTQNLGNLDSKLKGYELEVNARPVDRARTARGLRLHAQPHHGHGGPDGDRQRGAAGDTRYDRILAPSTRSRWAPVWT